MVLMSENSIAALPSRPPVSRSKNFVAARAKKMVSEKISGLLSARATKPKSVARKARNRLSEKTRIHVPPLATAL
jgi:hypothetical protein